MHEMDGVSLARTRLLVATTCFVLGFVACEEMRGPAVPATTAPTPCSSQKECATGICLMDPCVVSPCTVGHCKQ